MPETTAGTVEATPLKMPVTLDLVAYRDVVIHDANWRRVASYPKTELGIQIAQQVAGALNSHDATKAQLAELREALRGVGTEYEIEENGENVTVLCWCSGWSYPKHEPWCETARALLSQEEG